MVYRTFINLGGLISDSVLWQVEHMLNDRLLNFVDIDLHDVKVLGFFAINTQLWNHIEDNWMTQNFCLIHFQDAHKRFDKASLVYDQASYLIILFSVRNVFIIFVS